MSTMLNNSVLANGIPLYDNAGNALSSEPETHTQEYMRIAYELDDTRREVEFILDGVDLSDEKSILEKVSETYSEEEAFYLQQSMKKPNSIDVEFGSKKITVH